MNEDKTQELLLQLIKDMSYVKAKLDNLDEQKLSSRVDALEAQNKEHDRIIKTLENRAGTMEQFTRNNLTDAKKQQTGVFISMGMAVFSSVLSLLFSFLR
jgi:hypothetical protein